VTEKLWGPYEAGTVPVYFGAPNIKQLAPNRSYIDVDDFATPDDLARYLHTVANNQTLYESYHSWRLQPLPPHFTAKFNISKTHSTCRTCRWAFAKMYGLGWNHENQTIAPELQSTARSVCLVDNASNKNVVGTSAGIITRPFREVWLDALTNEQVIPEPGGVATDAACQEVNSQTRVLHLQHGQLKRTVWEQDGVVDIVLDYDQTAQLDEAIQLQLRLETPLQEPVQALRREGQIRLQNHESRFTLLTWPALVVNITQHVAASSSALNGNTHSALVVNLHHVATNPASSSFPLRLRIIVEDVDLFHKGADKLENYFGSLMIDDFFHPVETFY
jgi:Glycosyltransferase family 10 (fucosyltransferase) C-term